MTRSRSILANRGLLALVFSGLMVLALVLYGPSLWSQWQTARLTRLKPEELQSIVRREPGNIQARYQLGKAYARANRFPEATREFLAVLDKEPVRADVLNDLGVCYLLMGRYRESLVALRGALQAKPDFAAALANMGRLHLAVKMPYMAARYLSQAARLEPKNIAILCDLGEAYHRTLNFKSAKETYERALDSNPRSVLALIGLGKTCYSLTLYDEAEKALQKALALAPEDPVALNTLGRMRLDRALSASDLQEVRRLLEKSAHADPQDPDTWYDLGRTALRQKRPQEAVEALKRALALSPQHPGAMHQLERALRAIGQNAEADRVAKAFKEFAARQREEDRLAQYIERTPNDWDARARLAEIYLLNGKRSLAMLVFKQLAEGSPNHPRLPALQRMMQGPPAQTRSESPPPKGP